MSVFNAVFSAAMNGEKLSPQIKTSRHYRQWESVKDLRRCLICENNHGKIWPTEEDPLQRPPAHIRCRCRTKLMQAIAAGTATISGHSGADWTLKFEKELPTYYITERELKALGWRRGKSPSEFAENRMLSGGTYNNINGHLPQKAGRIWYEADINYTSGKRNSQRILWSNDGLIFVTYDHYTTFYEID